MRVPTVYRVLLCYFVIVFNSQCLPPARVAVILCCAPTVMFVKVFSTDDCCTDKEVVQDSLGPAAAPVSPIPLAESVKSLPPLTFPVGKTPKVIQPSSLNCGIASHAIELLLQEAKKAVMHLNIPGMVPALGFDAEWEV